MTNKTYICVQSCILHGKRFEEGDVLPFGMNPNQYFKDAETDELMPALVVEKKVVNVDMLNEPSKSEQEAQKAVVIELQKQVKALVYELDNIKIGVACEIDELKATIVLLSDKVDLLEETQKAKVETQYKTTDKTIKSNK